MKRIIILALVAISSEAAADQYVRGYTRSDGTYVQPHHRSSPDGQKWNNYSSQGNINPYTGQRGSERNSMYDGRSPGSYGRPLGSYNSD